MDRVAKLVECVPNFSEGRRVEVVDRLAAAITRTPGALLLDRTSDASHNRSVLTLAGEPEAVIRAMELAVEVAVGEIDMERQTGEHPRIGAVDVIPFVPLGDTTLDECVELARAFGARIASRFDLPVYLYAAAASRSDRVKLADVRRGPVRGPQGRDRQRGPAARLRPGPDASLGRRRRRRSPAVPDRLQHQPRLERHGAGPADRPPGARVGRRPAPGPGDGRRLRDPDRPACAQVSMNLLDFSVTPLWLVWDTVRTEAEGDGVDLLESELIGLCPLAAFLAVADHAGFDPSAPVEERCAAAAGYLRLRDFSPMQVLELRLAAAQLGDGDGA